MPSKECNEAEGGRLQRGSGKVETLQASAEAAQLPPRRKAAARSEMKRTIPESTHPVTIKRFTSLP
ncbi:hypothetical protein BACI349Y_760091 [Bacillus sp. 349Y]|nr:hypothetical protein BACI349Y_760091 [Bacillus sp. 349Y]